MHLKLFVNSVKVCYDQTKVSHKMEESMTIIYIWNVLSFSNIYKMSERVVITQMSVSSSCLTFECDSVSGYLHA